MTGEASASDGRLREIESRQSLAISFRGWRVLVSSNGPEVLSGLARIFVQLPDDPGSRLAGAVDISRDDDGYHLPAEGEASVRGGTLANVLECGAYHVARLFVAATPELVWLHAGAAARAGGALLFLGPSGRGKSTLTAALVQHGWRYLGDDLIPLECDSRRLVPFPRAPAYRARSVEELPSTRLGELEKIELSLAQGAICREPVGIGALILPRFSLGEPSGLAACRPAQAAAELLASYQNFVSRGTAGVHLMADLARCHPAFHLTYRDPDQAANLLENLDEHGVPSAYLPRIRR